MQKAVQIILILLAGASVGVADFLLKKISRGQTFIQAVGNPWIAAVAALYIIQISIFIYLFVKKWELGIVGVLQIVLYTAIVVGGGWLFFKEKLSPVQGIGMGLALLGAVLMNLK